MWVTIRAVKFRPGGRGRCNRLSHARPACWALRASQGLSPITSLRSQNFLPGSSELAKPPTTSPLRQKAHHTSAEGRGLLTASCRCDRGHSGKCGRRAQHFLPPAGGPSLRTKRESSELEPSSRQCGLQPAAGVVESCMGSSSPGGAWAQDRINQPRISLFQVPTRLHYYPCELCRRVPNLQTDF